IVKHYGIPDNICHPGIVDVLISAGEGQLDGIRQPGTVNITVHAEPQPSDSCLKFFSTKIIATERSILQPALHTKTEIDIKCRVVAGILDTFKVFNGGPLVAFPLGGCRIGTRNKNQNHAGSQYSIIHGISLIVVHYSTAKRLDGRSA